MQRAEISKDFDKVQDIPRHILTNLAIIGNELGEEKSSVLDINSHNITHRLFNGQLKYILLKQFCHLQSTQRDNSLVLLSRYL